MRDGKLKMKMTDENRSKHEYLRNPLIDERYVAVYCHEGAYICTLEIARPADGDSFGYLIDFIHFEGLEFDSVQDAVEHLDMDGNAGYRWDSEPEEIDEGALSILNDLAESMTGKNESESLQILDSFFEENNYGKKI
ncbi:hypothetical protein [Paenibacillus sp. DRB1-1]|uniref:hypothetical protein n=1 Tax=Paenibacillus sp. DRB1-1 TaxID=3422309 RepID=UPI003F98F5F9